MRLVRPADVMRFARQLARRERLSAIRAAADGCLVTIGLRKRGVRPLLTAQRAAGGTADPQRAVRVAGAVDAGLGILPVAATCLRRSLTLTRELDRIGIASTLCLGVRMTEGRVEAHAWVQVGPVVVNDEPQVIARYTALVAGEFERLVPFLR